MSREHAAALWRRGQEGWPRSFPVAQFPNAPLLVAIGGFGLAAATHGNAHDVGRAVSSVGLAAFAWLELVDGANWFRRLLGAAVLAGLVVRLAHDG